MNADTKLLNEIYREAINAIAIISAILQKLPEGDFFDVLFEKMTRYREIANQAVDLIEISGEKITKQDAFDRISLKTAQYMATKNNRKDYVLGILKKGSLEGIKDITECINMCTDAAANTRHLAYRLIAEEENSVGVMHSL